VDGNLDPWSVETMTTRYRKSRSDYPEGVLAIYDNGGSSIDRYCVVFAPFAVDGKNYFPTLHMSERPIHPQGYGIHGEYERRPTRLPGDHVIAFDALPEECQKCVESDLAAS
jgi:hypothetical protein